MNGSVPQIPGVKAEERLARDFRREVANLLNRNNVGFPGAQPVSFARHHLDELCRRDYFLCEKTDGIRCLLYCTQDQRNQEIHYLIDRKNDYYFLQGASPPKFLHFPHHEDPSFQRFHTETLLDGELVLDFVKGAPKPVLRYLVFDCLLFDGEILMQKPLDKRLARFREFIHRPLRTMLHKFPEERQHQLFEVVFKEMDKPYALENMFNIKLPSLPHGNDGLVFTCKDTPYVFGTDEHILKWKPAHENSIDFKLRLGTFPILQDEEGPYEDFEAMPDFTLLVYHGDNRYEPFAPLYITDEDWQIMKRLGQVLDGRIIECYRDEEGRWQFKKEHDGSPRFRDDKLEANHISTVNKVLQSISDAVSQEDLIAAAPAIMRAWKARHPEEEEAKRRHAQARPPNGH
ncbi:mRNA capping enzyme, alpha subunit [Trichodelitschia bisporula]|uniref:mRNA-capping enzyme subunit alpha n=1 Tax=Trichodelitschia bisporula TaxID=703511 RepID=A0A6G1HXW3_9PEZI|nr:mRNA capping enzyme, alpha subunit [Trichodelitschia bisporula]